MGQNESTELDVNVIPTTGQMSTPSIAHIDTNYFYSRKQLEQLISETKEGSTTRILRKFINDKEYTCSCPSEGSPQNDLGDLVLVHAVKKGDTAIIGKRLQSVVEVEDFLSSQN